MAGGPVQKETTREKSLYDAIIYFQGSIIRMQGVEDARSDVQTKLLDPQKNALNPSYDKWLTTPGRPFYLPPTEQGRKAAESFARSLQNLGYAAIVLEETEGGQKFNVLYVGQYAIERVNDFKLIAVPTAAQRKALDAFMKSADATVAILDKNGYDADWIFMLRKSVQEAMGAPAKAAPKEEVAIVPKPAPVEEAPREERPAAMVPTAPEKQAKELARLEQELEQQLALLRENAQPWGEKKRPRIVQGYNVLMQIRETLETEGAEALFRKEGKAMPLNDFFVGTPKRAGEVVRTEMAIGEVQKAYARAEEILGRMWQLDSVKALDAGKAVEAVKAKIGKEVFAYQPAPIKVKTEEGFDIYSRKEEKGQTVYALSDTEAAPQPKAQIAAVDSPTRYGDLLYAMGLDDSMPVYKQGREALVNNLTAEQLDAVMEYAQGKRNGLSLAVPKEKQGEIERAIAMLCQVNTFKEPEFEPLAPAGKIEVRGRATPVSIPQESLNKLKEWDSGNRLTAQERQMLASRFSYDNLSKILDFIDQSRLAFSQGREPLEYLSSDQAVPVPKEGLDRQTMHALNSIFLYCGGLSVGFYENAGYVYSTIPAMYTEPEKMVFKFPRKVSHKEDVPGARERWLNLEKSETHPEPDVSIEKLREITSAINSGKGGEIQFGKLFRETPEEARQYDAYIRKARIVAGYLNDHGIRASVAEFSEFDPKRGEDRNGVKIVIPQNAMGVGEVTRKPNLIEVVQEPSPAAAAKIDPLRAIQNLPQNIATSPMKNALLSFVEEKKEGTIACSSQDQATRMRNWLIMNGGIPAGNLEIDSTETSRKVSTKIEGDVKVKGTRWMLRYSPEPVTSLELTELEKRGKKEPVHLTQTQEAMVLSKRGAALKGELEDAAEAYEKSHPGEEVTVEYFSQVSGTKKRNPAPNARETFHNEAAFGDAFLAMAFQFALRTEGDLPKAPAVGGYRRLREALETGLSAMTEDGKFRHGDRFAMMMLREWRHPGEPLSSEEKTAVTDAWGALDRKYANIEEFKKEIPAENALKLEASANWLADRWVAQYNTKGMKAEEVESLRNSLKEVAWRTMMVVIQLEAGPAHYGISFGNERPKTPEDNLAGALFYTKNTVFNAKDGKTYQTYFQYEGVTYNILSRRVLTAGPNPEHFVTIPSKEPGKVILYGRLKQTNVQLEDGRWVPAYDVEVLPKKERKVMDRDSLGEASFTPEFAEPLLYAKVRIGKKPGTKIIEVEKRVTIAPRIEADEVMFSAGMEIKWDKIYLKFLVPKSEVFAAMGRKAMMLENIAATSTTPDGEIFILPPRHRQNEKGEESDADKGRKYFVPGLGGTVYSSAYVDKSGKVYAFMKEGKTTPENAREYYASKPEELAKDKVEKREIGARDPKTGKVVLYDNYKSEFSPHIFGSRLVRENELVEEGSTKNDKGETVDYRYRLKEADIGAHRHAVASGKDKDNAYVGTNIPLQAKGTTKVSFKAER